MVSWPVKSKRAPIGLDVGSRFVKAVQVRPTDKGPVIEAAVCVPRAVPDVPLDEIGAARIRDVLDRQGFVGDDVIVAVPGEKLISGILELPARSSGAPLDQIARTELAHTSKHTPDSFEMAYWDLPVSTVNRGPSDGTLVMAVACAHDDANTLLDVLETQGLYARALDATACAVVRACTPLAGDPRYVWAVLDLGWTAAVLYVMHQGVVMYQRVMADLGLHALHEKLQKHLALEPQVVDYLLTRIGLNAMTDAGRQGAALSPVAGALVNDARDLILAHVDTAQSELRTSFAYALHQYPTAEAYRLMLVGGGAALPGLDERLRQTMDVEVSVVTPGELAGCAATLQATCAQPALVAALGLGLFAEA